MQHTMHKSIVEGIQIVIAVYLVTAQRTISGRQLQQILGQKVAFPRGILGGSLKVIFIAQQKELLTDAREGHVESILVEKSGRSLRETEKD